MSPQGRGRNSQRWLSGVTPINTQGVCHMRFQIADCYKIVGGFKVCPGDILFEDGAISKLVVVDDKLQVYRKAARYWRTDWLSKGRDEDVDWIIAKAKSIPTEPVIDEDGVNCSACGKPVFSQYCPHCGQAILWRSQYWAVGISLDGGVYTVYGNGNVIEKSHDRNKAVSLFNSLVVANPAAKVTIHISKSGDWVRAEI